MNRKNKVMMVLSVLMVATLMLCCALAPVVLFEMNDRAMFTASNSRNMTGGTLNHYVGDVHMMQALWGREESAYEYSPSNTQYLSQQSNEETGTLLPRLSEYAQQLHDAGVIDTILWEYMNHLLGGSDVCFTHWVNKAGFEGITCFLGKEAAPGHLYYMLFEIETQTNKVINLELELPIDDTFPIVDTETNVKEQLENYIMLLELDAVTDWMEDSFYWGGTYTDFPGRAAFVSSSSMLRALATYTTNGVDANTVSFSVWSEKSALPMDKDEKPYTPTIQESVEWNTELLITSEENKTGTQ